VPVINIRHALLPILQRYPERVKDYFVYTHPDPKRVDLLHLNALGHQVLAETTIAFIKRQKCIVENGRPEVEADPILFPTGENYDTGVPRLSLLSSSWHVNKTAPIDRPTCSTIDSLDAPLTPLASSHGWTHWLLPHTTKHYWRGDKPGARIDFAVDLTAGHIQLYFLRSKRMGLGLVKCWIGADKNEASGLTLDGYWDDPTNVGVFVTINAKPLPAGQYELHCKLLEKQGKEEGRGTAFLIIAVFTI